MMSRGGNDELEHKKEGGNEEQRWEWWEETQRKCWK